MDKLNSCPFCGSEAIFEQTSTNSDISKVTLYFQIQCKKCRATIPDAYGSITLYLSRNGELYVCHDDRTSAIEIWNRRFETNA